MSGETVSSGELITDGLCSPACLLAVKDEECTCRCQGEFHGALKNVQIETSVEIGPWWVRCSYAGWDPEHLRATAPVTRTPRESARIYERAGKRLAPFSEVGKVKGGWSVRWDAITACSYPVKWPEREADLLNRIVTNLLKSGHAEWGSLAPCEYFSVYPLRSLDEACVLWCILVECWSGTPDGALRAIEALEGQMVA